MSSVWDLTSSPPSAFGCRAWRGKDRDPLMHGIFCKTATSRRENVHCRIDVVMMIRARLRFSSIHQGRLAQ